MRRSVVVLGAPTAIGLRPYDDGEVRRLDVAPGVLREHGLVTRLGANDLGDVMPPFRYADLVKPVGRGRNEEDVASYSQKLADRVASAVSSGDFLVVLGGDCSILLGALLGLRRAGKDPVGLAYVDAHADFATLAESPSGSACSMNLALAVGRAASPLARLAENGPLVRGADVAHIGRRDDSQPEYGYPALAEFDVLDLSQADVDADGADAVVATALERVTEPEGGFWIHFDVDVLDPQLMPAVDTPLAGGFDLDTACKVLAPLVAHPKALGLQLTIYDPTTDHDSIGARHLVDLIERTFVGDG